MKDTRKLTGNRLLQACYNNTWYTKGCVYEFMRMVQYCDHIENFTISDLASLADEIKTNSDTNYSVSTIMSILVNEYCTIVIWDD